MYVCKKYPDSFILKPVCNDSRTTQLGMGPMPFIMFLMLALVVSIACCFANRERILEWMVGAGQTGYSEIRSV
jgi:hypothetical protein